MTSATLWLTETIKTPSAASGGWTVLLGFLGFALILALSYLALRWLNKRNALGARSRYMAVLDRMAVSRDCTLLIVRILDEIYAVGVTKDGVEQICRVDPEVFEAYPPPPRGFFRSRAEVRSDTTAAQTEPVAAPRAETVTPSAEQSPPAEPSRGKDTFLRRFVHNLGVNSGVLPKDTPPRRPPAKPQTETSTSFSEVLRQTQEHPRPKPDSVSPSQEDHDVMGRATPARQGPVGTNEPNDVPRATRRDYDSLFEGIRSYSEAGVMPSKEPRPRPAPQETQASSVPKAVAKPPSAPPSSEENASVSEQAPPPTVSKPASSPDDPLDNLRDRMSRRSANIKKKWDEDKS